MEILKTIYGTYIIRFVRDKDPQLNIVNDCFNSRLVMYHFLDYDLAFYFANKVSMAKNGEDLQMCLDSMPEEFHILRDMV